MKHKLKVRKEKIANNVKYISLEQVVEDYTSGRSNVTKDIDFEIIEDFEEMTKKYGSMPAFNQNVINAENYYKKD